MNGALQIARFGVKSTMFMNRIHTHTGVVENEELRIKSSGTEWLLGIRVPEPRATPDESAVIFHGNSGRFPGKNMSEWVNSLSTKTIEGIILT
jgi:hypothetical protein